MSDSTDKVGQSIGERLEAARHLAGVTPAVAAERLHLDPSVIEALEANRFAALGAPVYVRGHLRRYAEFLGLSPDALVAEYQASLAPNAAPDLTRIPQADRPSDPQKLLGPSIAAAAAVLLGVAVWWVVQNTGKEAAAPAVIAKPQSLPPVTVPVEAAPTATPAATPDSGAAPSAGVSPTTATPAPTSAAPAAAPTSAPVVVPMAAAPSNSSSEPTASSPTTVAPAPAPRPSRELTVQLRFPTDSWVEVYDARGRRLFYDVATGGSSQTVTGRGPLRVVLGNATGVGVAVDGRDKAIPNSAVRGEEARFVVTESGSLVRSR